MYLMWRKIKDFDIKRYFSKLTWERKFILHITENMVIDLKIKILYTKDIIWMATYYNIVWIETFNCL
jgi:hypothetical protein